jgi:hypothetical protein
VAVGILVQLFWCFYFFSVIWCRLSAGSVQFLEVVKHSWWLSAGSVQFLEVVKHSWWLSAGSVQSWSVSCSVSGGLWWLSIGSGGAFLVNHILSDSIFLGFIMSSSDSFWVLFTGKN